MRWYEYKMEVDDLHAPDDLKAKLLAMQAAAEQAGTEQPVEPEKPIKKKKKAIHFPVRQLGTLAACAAICVVGGSVLFGTTMRAGSSDMMQRSRSTNSVTAGYEAAAYGVLPEAVSFQMENGVATLSMEDAEGTTGARSVEKTEKIIYTANLSLESKDYDASRKKLDEALDQAEGYMEGSDEYTRANSSRSISLTLRIPQENYESFLEAAAQAGNLTSKSQQAEDVTTQYMDLEARLANLFAQRTRLQELQQQAESLSDLLEIESSLSDVQYQIESWQSQLDWYSQQVEYCTVYVGLSEVQTYSPSNEDFAARIAAAFGEGWEAFVNNTQQLAVSLIYGWPVVVLVVAAGTVVLIVYHRKKRKN